MDPVGKRLFPDKYYMYCVRNMPPTCHPLLFLGLPGCGHQLLISPYKFNSFSSKLGTRIDDVITNYLCL